MFYQKLPFEGTVVGCLQLSVGVLHEVSSSQSQLEDGRQGSVGRVQQSFHLMDHLLGILSRPNLVFNKGNSLTNAAAFSYIQSWYRQKMEERKLFHGEQ